MHWRKAATAAGADSLSGGRCLAVFCVVPHFSQYLAPCVAVFLPEHREEVMSSGSPLAGDPRGDQEISR